MGNVLITIIAIVQKKKMSGDLAMRWQAASHSMPAVQRIQKAMERIASYLSRTLDFGECRADSVGCRAYSTEQANGEWVASGSP